MSSKNYYRVGSKIFRKPLFYCLFVIVLEARLADYVFSIYYPDFVLWTIASALVQVFILYLVIYITITTVMEEMQKPNPFSNTNVSSKTLKSNL